MKKNPLQHSLSEYENTVYQSDDLVPIYYIRNGCGYRWGIPFKSFGTFEKLKKPYKIEELTELGAVLLDILVLDKYSIDFKDAKSGVKKLEVTVRSSESEDKQLLHKIVSGFRANDEILDKDNMPGTNDNDHE